MTRLEYPAPMFSAWLLAVALGCAILLGIWHVADKAMTQTARDACEFYCELELSE